MSLEASQSSSRIFTNDVRDREVKWLGTEDAVVWLKDADGGTTEIWIGHANDTSHTLSYCAGRIAARASNLKVKPLDNEDMDIAIAVSAPATKMGTLANPVAANNNAPCPEIFNAIWYSTLHKKRATQDVIDAYVPYTVSPARFINALRGTGLESPLPFPLGGADDFDISSSGLVFLSKDPAGGSLNFPLVSAYYIPLQTFLEISRPRPQIIRVAEYEGRSACPVFSPNGSALAFLKKKHPIDQNDRNRVVVINNIREFRFPLHTNLENARTMQSEKDWHLSPYSIAWSDDGEELYVVAVDRGERKLFKIPAAVSSIRNDPVPIDGDSKTHADVKHMRMVFSAPMAPNVGKSLSSTPVTPASEYPPSLR